MCHEFLADSSFFEFLQRIDDEYAEKAKAAGCPECAGTPHSARYPRKPRGVLRAVLGPEYDWRQSYCCSCDGCRRRTTPASVRFLGRRVYLGVVVVLVSALNRDSSAQRLGWPNEYLPLSAKTLRRWRQWWQSDFVATRFWRDARARLAASLAPSSLP